MRSAASSTGSAANASEGDERTTRAASASRGHMVTCLSDVEDRSRRLAWQVFSGGSRALGQAKRKPDSTRRKTTPRCARRHLCCRAPRTAVPVSFTDCTCRSSIDPARCTADARLMSTDAVRARARRPAPAGRWTCRRWRWRFGRWRWACGRSYVAPSFSSAVSPALHHHTNVVDHGVAMAPDAKAIRQEERQRQLKAVVSAERRTRVLRLLRKGIWPSIPKKQRRRRLTRAEEDAILGCGKDGV